MTPLNEHTEEQTGVLKVRTSTIRNAIPLIVALLGATGITVGGQYIGIAPHQQVDQGQVNTAVGDYMDEAVTEAREHAEALVAKEIRVALKEVDHKVSASVTEALEKVDVKMKEEVSGLTHRIRTLLDRVKESLGSLEKIMLLKAGQCEKDTSRAAKDIDELKAQIQKLEDHLMRVETRLPIR
jgi:polyhydroxyalkanoate synthesis regulator phasin